MIVRTQFRPAVLKRWKELAMLTAAPTKFVAEEFGDIPIATIRRWVNEARRDGDLPLVSDSLDRHCSTCRCHLADTPPELRRTRSKR